MQPAAGEEWKSLFLPLISTDMCSAGPEVVSPFSLEIAAIHEIEAASGGLMGPPESMPAWLTFSDSEFTTLLDALKESGAAWTRVRVPWRHIQPDPPPAEYAAWHFYDGRLAKIGEAGVQSIVTVANPECSVVCSFSNRNT